jgi:hypothetical protein
MSITAQARSGWIGCSLDESEDRSNVLLIAFSNTPIVASLIEKCPLAQMT